MRRCRRRSGRTARRSPRNWSRSPPARAGRSRCARTDPAPDQHLRLAGGRLLGLCWPTNRANICRWSTPGPPQPPADPAAGRPLGDQSPPPDPDARGRQLARRPRHADRELVTSTVTGSSAMPACTTTAPTICAWRCWRSAGPRGRDPVPVQHLDEHTAPGRRQHRLPRPRCPPPATMSTSWPSSTASPSSPPAPWTSCRSTVRTHTPKALHVMVLDPGLDRRHTRSTTPATKSYSASRV